MKRRIAALSPLVIGVLLGSMLVGCGSPQYRPTAKESASFKGGPMPASVRQKLSEMQRAPKPIPPHP